MKRYSISLLLALSLSVSCRGVGLCEGEACAGEDAGSKDAASDAASTWMSTPSESAEVTTSSETSVAPTSGGDSTVGNTATESASAAATSETDTGPSAVCSPQSEEGCEGETPWCLGEGETKGDGGLARAPRCVECEDDTHCQWPYVEEAQNGICLEYACARCELGSNRGCGQDAPYCVEVGAETDEAPDASVGQSTGVVFDAGELVGQATGATQCMECLSEADCGGATPACVDHTCVECESDVQCTSADASRCDVTSHECVGCNAVGGCAHIAETPACDVETGRCVECTREEDGACNGGLNEFDYACVTIAGHPEYHTCSDLWRGNSGQCIECVSDSQCLTGFACVPETYGEPGADGGAQAATGKHYCMAVESALGDNKECIDNRPFVGEVTATSEGDVTETYCRPGHTTCEAYLDWKNGPDIIPDGQPGAGGTTCLSDDSCGLPQISDAYCVPVSANTNRCTYECASDDDCPGVSHCDKGNPPGGVLPGNGVCAVN